MRLILLRHAKSAWNTDADTDHARPLNKRGRKDAPRIGSHLAKLGWQPEQILCSDAVRTRETWTRMAPLLAPKAPVFYTSSLYHAGPTHVLPWLAQQVAETVMVIGHNPGWEALLEVLSGQAQRLTTCNAALLETTASSWAEAGPGRWTLIDIIRPKEL